MILQRNEWAEVATGAVVLAVALGFLAYAVGLVGGIDRGDTATYRVSLPEARGLRDGSAVRVAGVKVGEIDWIRLNPETFAAETELSLDAAIRFPQDSVAMVASEGLLGARFLEIQPGGSGFPLAPGDRFRARVPETGLVDLLLQSLGGGR